MDILLKEGKYLLNEGNLSLQDCLVGGWGAGLWAANKCGRERRPNGIGKRYYQQITKLVLSDQQYPNEGSEMLSDPDFGVGIERTDIRGLLLFHE